MSQSSPITENLSILIISSPAPNHPSTSLIQRVIDSLQLLSHIDSCPILIVLDGYIVSSEARTKKGKVTDDLGRAYEEYYRRLTAEYDSPKVRILRCKSHYGFAMAVKYGLENCQTQYALILQHDRVFCSRFDRIHDLIDVMENDETIRYIGFPTINNISHDEQIHSRYGLSCLNGDNVRISLGRGLSLQPLIFWFDSNHLCHTKRYLQIYTPWRSLQPELRERLGARFCKDMLLRKGDFIEDRFGQMQRKCLMDMKGMDEGMIVETFRWFGSYLIWMRGREAAHVSSEHVKESAVDALGNAELDDCSYGSEQNMTKIDVGMNVSFPVQLGASITNAEYFHEKIGNQFYLVEDKKELHGGDVNSGNKLDKQSDSLDAYLETKMPESNSSIYITTPHVRVMVAHLRGRKKDPLKIAYWQQTASSRRLKRAELLAACAADLDTGGSDDSDVDISDCIGAGEEGEAASLDGFEGLLSRLGEKKGLRDYAEHTAPGVAMDAYVSDSVADGATAKEATGAAGINQDLTSESHLLCSQQVKPVAANTTIGQGDDD